MKYQSTTAESVKQLTKLLNKEQGVGRLWWYPIRTFNTMENFDYYNVEQKAKEASLKSSKKGKNTKPTNHRTQFDLAAKNFDQKHLFTATDVKQLHANQYDNPVVSFYLNLTPDKLIRERKVYLTVFNSLKHAELQEKKKYLQSLSHDNQASITQDLKDIDHYLQESFIPEETKSLVVFTSAKQLHRIYRLQNEVEDCLIINAVPYTIPLEEQLDKFSRILVTHVHQEWTMFFNYASGYIELIAKVKSEVPSDNVDLGRPNKVQRHRQTHLDIHFNQSAEKIYDLLNEITFDGIILAGEESTAKKFYEYLHADHKNKVVDFIHLATHHINNNDLKSAVQKVLEKENNEKEKLALQDIEDFQSQGILVKGLAEVIEAQNRFLTRKLYVKADEHIPGYMCPKDKYLSVSQGACPICENRLINSINLMDEVVENAYRRHNEVVVFHTYKNEVEKFNKIAAVVYEAQ